MLCFVFHGVFTFGQFSRAAHREQWQLKIKGRAEKKQGILKMKVSKFLQKINNFTKEVCRYFIISYSNKVEVLHL